MTVAVDGRAPAGASGYQRPAKPLGSLCMQSDLGPVVAAAAAGDQAAWDTIVERFSGLVWAIARGFRLSAADAADVSQVTWLRVIENLESLRQPAALGAWIATTTRREALQVLRRRREIPVDDAAWADVVDDREPPPGHGLLRAERDRELWGAFDRLPVRCQALLRLLVVDPVDSYAAAAAALEIPIGSLGPARGRCLAALRHELQFSPGAQKAAR
jgi:RNA polymerase sigma factor (sigma-70 family)